jgi:integrase
MGVSVRQKGSDWYIFVRHHGERAAQKCVDQQHAEDVQKAVKTAISSGQFDISKVQRKREEAAAAAKPESAPTLAAFFDKTMSPFWKATQTPATFTRYESAFRLHIRPALGDIPLTQLTRDQTKDFVIELLQKEAVKRTETESERKLSYDSIRMVAAVLRTMLNEAVDRKVITVNPAVRLGKLFRQASKVRDEVDPFTAEEIPILLNVTSKHFGYENYVVLLTLFHTGLRSSELAGLQWPDVDFRGKFITVRRQYKKGKVLNYTKTKKRRKVDVSDALLQELQSLKKRRQAEYLSRGKNEIPEWVFLSPGRLVWKDGKAIAHDEGRPMVMNNYSYRVYSKACDKANVRRRRLHDTRHSFATLLIMDGESLAYVRDQLGHASIKQTVDTYTHWIPGSNRQAVNKLPALTSSITPLALATNGN